jgi:predicted DCC family thiol-disulfide oxidoreductase YuxK
MKPCFHDAQSLWMPRPAPGWPNQLVLFDGVCIFCSGWVRFVIERDDACRFRFMPIQSPQGQRLARELGIDPEHPATNVVIVDGVAFFKSDAALAVLRHLRGMKWTAVLGVVPKGLRNWVYDRIAQNRYALFGRSESCMRPTPDIAARFLDDAEKATRL